MKKTIIVLIFIACSASAALAATYAVTQTGDGADYSAATFNALTGDKGGNTYYFSGTFTTRISVTAAYGNAEAPMVLDGYQAGDCDPINSTCTSSAVLSQGLEVGNGTHGPDYLTIQDFRMTRTSSTLPGFRLYGYLSGTEAQKYVDHCIIQRNHVYETYGTLFYWYNGRYNVIQNNKFTHFGQGNTDATQGINILNLNYTLIRGNEFGHDDTLYPSGCTSANTIEVHHSNNQLWEYNAIYGAPNQAGIHWKEAGNHQDIVFRFNKVYGNHSRTAGGLQAGKGIVFGQGSYGNTYYTKNIYVYGNFVYNNFDMGIGLQAGVQNAHVWSNIVVKNGRNGIIPFVNYYGPTDVYIHNNTIVRGGSTGESEYTRGGVTITGGSGFSLKNNLFFDNQPTSPSGLRNQIASLVSITSEHNTFWHSDGAPTFYYNSETRTFAQMQGYGLEDDLPAGAVEDPLFVDPDGADNTYGTEDDDYTLTASSPAIDDGAILLGTYTVALSGGDAWFEAQTGYATISMTGAEALAPTTDWSGQPTEAKIDIADRDTVGWDRGAYAYSVAETPLEIVFYYPLSSRPCISNPRDVSIGVTTNIAASCRYSTDPLDTTYASMSDQMEISQGTYSLAANLQDLACGYSGTYYMICNDGTTDSERVTVTVAVENYEPALPPATMISTMPIVTTRSN